MSKPKSKHNTLEHFSKVTDEVLIAYLAKGLSGSWQLVRSTVADVEDFIESLNEYPEVAEWMVDDVAMFQNLFTFNKIDDMKAGLEMRLTEYFEQISEPYSIVMQRFNIPQSVEYTDRIGTDNSLAVLCTPDQSTPRYEQDCMCSHLMTLDHSLNMHVECLETLATMLEDLYDKAVHVRGHAKRLVLIEDQCSYQYSPHLPFSLLHNAENDQQNQHNEHIKPFTFQRCYGSHILASRMMEKEDMICDEGSKPQQVTQSLTKYMRTLSEIIDEGRHSTNIDVRLDQVNKGTSEIDEHDFIAVETASRHGRESNATNKYVNEESVLTEQFANAKEFIKRLEMRVSTENQRLNDLQFRNSHLEAENIARKEFLADDGRAIKNFIKRCKDISKPNTEYNKVIENYIALSREINYDVDDLENIYREINVEYDKSSLHNDLVNTVHCPGDAASETRKRVVRFAEQPVIIGQSTFCNHPVLPKACPNASISPSAAAANPPYSSVRTAEVAVELAEGHDMRFTEKSQNAYLPCLSKLKGKVINATKQLHSIKERRDQLQIANESNKYQLFEDEPTPSPTKLSYKDECSQIQRFIQESRRSSRRRHQSIVTLSKQCARMLGRLKSRRFISEHLEEQIAERERLIKEKHTQLRGEGVHLRRLLGKRAEDREKYSTLSKAIGDRQIALCDEKAKDVPLSKIHMSRKGVEDSKKKISLGRPQMFCV